MKIPVSLHPTHPGRRTVPSRTQVLGLALLELLTLGALALALSALILVVVP